MLQNKILQSKFFGNVIFQIVVFNLFIVIPAIRFFDKILTLWWFAVYFLFANLIFFYRKKIFNLNLFHKKWWILFLVFVTICNFFVYPEVDARRNQGLGSTGDDAIILAAETLKTTGKLYDVTINNHTPISPGPGWVLLNSGFVLSDLYFLFSPFYIFLTLLFLKKCGVDDRKINIFFFILGLSLVFWELLFNGHDILPLSLSFFILSLWIFKDLKMKIQLWKIFVMGFLLGVVSTSRIVFFFVPFLFSFLLMNYSKRNGWLLLITSVITNLVFNLTFFFLNDYFQPIHILDKGIDILGKIPFFLVILIGIILIFFLTKFKENEEELNNNKVLSETLLVFTCFFLPLSYFDLFRVRFDFSVWEGANYLMPIIPFYVHKLTIKQNS